MTGRLVLILTLAILGFAGVPRAIAQGDEFEKANCQEDFLKLRSAVEARGKALDAAGKQKKDAVEVCRLLRNFTSAEARMVKFLQEKKALCGIPDQIVSQASEGHTKAIAMRNQVCKVAAGPAAPPPPAPSQGLSGALGTPAFGGPPVETEGGSGVFDTLTGNVLRR
jgi:hypothetical protein